MTIPIIILYIVCFALVVAHYFTLRYEEWREKDIISLYSLHESYVKIIKSLDDKITAIEARLEKEGK